MSSSKFSDAIRRFGDNVKAKVERITEKGEVSFVELFTPAFMRAHTSVTTFEELIARGGFKVDTKTDFLAIPDAQWDAVIRAHTSFSSWQEMQKVAGAEWMKRQLAI